MAGRVEEDIVRSAAWAVLGALGLGLLAGAVGLVGVSVGAASLSVGGSVLGRTLLGLLVVAFVALVLARRGPWEWLPPILGVLAGGFLLDPLVYTAGATAGGPLFGVPLTGSTPLGLALDLAVWLGVGAAAALLGFRSRDDLV